MGTWGTELWDQRDAIEKHTQTGIEFLDKCAGFVKERIRIEQEYAKSLRRMVKQYQLKKKDEENLPFSYIRSFKNFLQENDDYAGQREIISEELYNTILKEMQKLSLDLKSERKRTLQKLTEFKNQLDHHHKSLLAAKKKYDQASEESNSAQKNYEGAEQSLDMTKAQILKYQKISHEKTAQANKACEEYKNSLDFFNVKQTSYYENELPLMITNELQKPEEGRIEKLSLFLQNFSNIHKKVLPIITKCLDGMTEAGKVCDAPADSLLLVDHHKSGELPPGDINFEEHGKSTNPVPMSKKSSRSSMFKKKDSILATSENIANDYSYLPPAQRKKKFNKAITSLEEQLTQLEKAKVGALKLKENSEKFGGDINDIENNIEAYEKEIERIRPLLHQYQCYLAATIDAELSRKESRSASVRSTQMDSFEPVVISDVTSQEIPSKETPTKNGLPKEEEAPPKESLPKDSPPAEVPPSPVISASVDTPPSPVISACVDTPDYTTCDEFHELQCRVLYDFDSTNDGEMSVRSGEELVVIDEDDGSGWTHVTRGGDEGYIPTSYIEWM